LRKYLFVSVALVALAMLARGFVTGLSWDDTPGRSELVILMKSLPESLDPVSNSSFENVLPLTGIYEGLVGLNPHSLNPEPCLAESWQVSEDGMRWTFFLKPGVRFSDGTDFDAEAVKICMSRIIGKQENEPYAGLVSGPVAAIETEGKYTVSFMLKYPYAPFLKNLALPFAAPMVSPASVSKYGDGFWRHPSGTGPYMLKEYSREKIVLQPNYLYHEKRIPMNRITIKPVPEIADRTQQILAGKADIVFSPDFESIKDLNTSNIRTLSVSGNDVSFLGFFTDRAPFNKKSLRQAVAYALDREKIVNRALSGDGRPASGLLPPPFAGNTTDIPKYSTDQVKNILASEGYDKGLNLTLITYRDSRRYCPPGGLALAEEIKRQLAPAGININIKVRPWNEHKEAVKNKAGDLFLYGWTGENSDPDNFLYPLLSSSQINNGMNVFGFSNNRLDVYLLTAQRINDSRTRNYMYTQTEDILADEMPLTALNHSIIRIAYKPAVKNISLSGLGLIDLHSIYKSEKY